MRQMILTGLLGAMLGGASAVAAGPEGREVPEPFLPFEHLIGSWKGQGIPTANRLKGWPEEHVWAWKFAKGVPVGMSITLDGDKALTRAELTCDATGTRYRLEGTDRDGKAVVYIGSYGGTSRSKMLTLDRVGDTAEGKDRLILWPYGNQIRYALWIEHQDPGAPRFKRTIEVGLTREGEAFAAGGSAADLPRCVITGGAAALTVSYQGKSYPICCSGCRDEFNDNPEKYVKKAALRTAQGGSKIPVKAANSGVGQDDGAFAGFGDAATTGPKATPRPAAPKAAATPTPTPATAPAQAPKAEEGAGKDEARAATLLRLGQNLERAGKAAAALPYFQRIVKQYPGTAAARSAAARVKALGGK